MNRRQFIAALAATSAGCSAIRPETQPTESPRQRTDENAEIEEVSGEWNTHLREYTRLGRGESIDEVAQVWETVVGNTFTQPPAQPLVAGDSLVYNQRSSIHVLNSITGEKIRAYTLPDDESLVGRATLNEKSLYAVTDSRLLEYETTSGAERTVAELSRSESFVASPIVTEDHLITGTSNGRLVGWEASGEESFMTATSGTPRNIAFSDDTVFLRTSDALQAIDTNTGAVRWTREIVTRGTLGDVPAVTTELVVAGTGDGRVVALDRVSGETAWIAEIEDTRCFSPTELGEYVYISDTKDKLYQMSSSSGEVRDILSLSPTADRPGIAATNMDRSPVSAGNQLLVPRSDGVLAFISTGDELEVTSSQALSHRVATAPAVVDGTVFVSSPPSITALTA